MPAPTHWLAVAAALGAGIVGGASLGKMSPALPFLKEEFGLSLIAAGWLVSIFNVIAVGSAIFFGVFSDRVGALRFCLAGLATQILGGVLGMIATQAPLLLASRLIQGVGFLSTLVAVPI